MPRFTYLVALLPLGCNAAEARFSPAPGYAAGAAVPPTTAEPWLEAAVRSYDQAAKTSNCRALNSTLCAIEWDSWIMLEALLPRTATVLELGARYGLTSCMVSHLLNNSGAQVMADGRLMPDAHPNPQPEPRSRSETISLYLNSTPPNHPFQCGAFLRWQSSRTSRCTGRSTRTSGGGRATLASSTASSHRRLSSRCLVPAVMAIHSPLPARRRQHPPPLAPPRVRRSLR